MLVCAEKPNNSCWRKLMTSWIEELGPTLSSVETLTKCKSVLCAVILLWFLLSKNRLAGIIPLITSLTVITYLLNTHVLLAPLWTADHKTICSSDREEPDLLYPTTHTIYDLRSSNIDALIIFMNSVNWEVFFKMTYSVIEKCLILEDVIKLGIRECIPSKRVTSSDRDKPRITPMIKNFINQKLQAYTTRNFATRNTAT